MPGKRVCIVGSGNWGSAIAKIIGHNVKASNRFEPLVNMWVFEETINGRKLTEIINTDHENVKYLPGHKLPKNVIAVPDVTEAVAGADILVFVIPHQFIRKLCDQMKPHINPRAIGISLIKYRRRAAIQCIIYMSWYCEYYCQYDHQAGQTHSRVLQTATEADVR
ncbi:hypothetical protein SRHO_G00103130 [Serrasalmus rhombeus]